MPAVQEVVHPLMAVALVVVSLSLQGQAGVGGWGGWAGWVHPGRPGSPHPCATHLCQLVVVVGKAQVLAPCVDVHRLPQHSRSHGAALNVPACGVDGASACVQGERERGAARAAPAPHSHLASRGPRGCPTPAPPAFEPSTAQSRWGGASRPRSRPPRLPAPPTPPPRGSACRRCGRQPCKRARGAGKRGGGASRGRCCTTLLLAVAVQHPRACGRPLRARLLRLPCSLPPPPRKHTHMQGPPTTRCTAGARAPQNHPPT